MCFVSGNFSLNPNNQPDLTSKKVTIGNRNFTNVDVNWDNVVANGQTKFSSIYLVTIGVLNGAKYQENVLGLVCIYHACTFLKNFFIFHRQ